MSAGNGPYLLPIGNHNQHLEREASSSVNLASPAQIGRYAASQLFNGKPFSQQQQQRLFLNQQQEVDWFQCVEPTRALFEQFVSQYNRTFESAADKLDRLNLFAITLKRTILLNRVIQNEILNDTNYERKQEGIRNYQFITPIGLDKNLALWYSDITDCELGLIKYNIFDIFRFIDINDFESAYKKVIDNSEFLPLLNDDGFEQLANILLIRLYDRFKGDEKMLQLFQWPNYLKKLASFVYNLRQLEQPQFKTKLSLIKFAYPSYYKDLKYNLQAANRTNDNLRMHHEYENYSAKLSRKFPNRSERNKRLSIFRQRYSHLELLNKFSDSADSNFNRWKNISFQPEWLRAYQVDGTTLRLSSDKLQQAAELDFNGNPIQADPGRFKLTQFSDLTDTEFVAFLTNDFSPLESDKLAGQFIDSNFPVRQLDDKYRAELALELEMRRTVLEPSEAPSVNQESSNLFSRYQQQQQQPQVQPRKSLILARRVIDELISDVGLPIGSVMLTDISEEEHVIMFNKIGAFFRKPYLRQSTNRLSNSDLLDEKQRRYEQFKDNYGRFKAWFIKEGWTNLNENQLIAMLRLSDLSWLEIKTSLFRVCCLTDESLDELSNYNATIQYMSSNSFLCQQMGNDDSMIKNLDEPEIVLANTDNERRQPLRSGRLLQGANGDELAALELYYYYCVHFNKHHNDLDEFNRRFNIFKYNIDHVRRHSCTRGLTLYKSLLRKKLDSLNNIDILDPRRSFTDDLNLDRFKYYEIPNLMDNSYNNNNNKVRYQYNQEDQATQDGVNLSRAGISYRREAFFSSLYNQGGAENRYTTRNNQKSYADKLTQAAQNSAMYSTRYRQHSVNRVYDYVMERYKLCLRTVNAPERNSYRQRCKSNGPLGDQAAQSPVSKWMDAETKASLLQAQQQEQCISYQMGLEFWAEGLVPQDNLSPQLIQMAKC